MRDIIPEEKVGQVYHQLTSKCTSSQWYLPGTCVTLSFIFILLNLGKCWKTLALGLDILVPWSLHLSIHCFILDTHVLNQTVQTEWKRKEPVDFA